nr:ankyrin repeat domain-containing protein 50-like [Lytechinus pictus]
MLRQLTELIPVHDLAEPLRSTHRENHNTETALFKSQTDILQAIDNKKGIMMVLLDLSAAFDTVVHTILLNLFRTTLEVEELPLNLLSLLGLQKRQVSHVEKKKNEDGQTPLHLVTLHGNLEATKIILSHGRNVDKEDNTGYSALLNAAKNGHKDLVRYFLGQGASVNKGNSKGWKPLYIAAGFGKLDMVQYLISHGAEVRKGNHDRWVLCRQSPGEEGYIVLTKNHVVRECEVGHYEMLSAAFNDQLNLISKEEEDDEVICIDCDGWTAMHSAAYNGHLKIIDYLISQGSEVNEGNAEGWNALHGVASNGHLNITKYLINKGAEVNKTDDEGVTALHLASVSGHLDVTKHLISQGSSSLTRGGNEGGLLYTVLLKKVIWIH